MSSAQPPARPSEERIPATLLTGFLGAGKTTLVNRVLTECGRERIAVLVNEYGDVPIDGKLVIRSDEEVIELANGCVCCSVRGDLVRALQRFRDARRIDRILIETSGLASPGPVMQTLLVEPSVSSIVRPAGVVTLVHTGLIEEQLLAHPEAGQQVGYADLVILNHLDRCAPGQLESAARVLRSLNPDARELRATRALVDVGALLTGLEDRGRTRSQLPVDAEQVVEHAHGAGAVTLRSQVPLRLDPLKIWLQFLTSRRSHELWRIKGILACEGMLRAVVVQSVYQYLELGPSEEAPPDESLLVVIGRDLDSAELERGWRACL